MQQGKVRSCHDTTQTRYSAQDSSKGSCFYFRKHYYMATRVIIQQSNAKHKRLVAKFPNQTTHFALKGGEMYLELQDVLKSFHCTEVISHHEAHNYTVTMAVLFW